MNELYRDNSIKALNFYSKALASGGCMYCGNCPIKQELMRMQGDGMIRERHAPLRRARHQRLMRGGVSTALVPYNPGIGTVSTYVNNVAEVADNAPVVTTAIVGTVYVLKSLYDAYKQARTEEAKQELASEIKKEGDKVVKQVAKQEKAIMKPRVPRKPRAAPRRPRAAPKRKATKKKATKCRLIKFRSCN